jgi:hypothetical protein
VLEANADAGKLLRDTAHRHMQRVRLFTIVTKSYLAYAKALAARVELFHPGAGFIIFVVDPEGMERAVGDTVAEIRSASDLFSDNTFRLMTGYYTADELCNACKPWAHAALLREESTQATLYLDSDVYLTGPLIPLLEDLGDKAILLTPHVIKPLVDGVNEGLERAFLDGGIFNGGCLALSNSVAANAFLEWWKERLRFQCLRFVPGLCVDQSWLNFVPAILPIDQVAVCRRPGVNVGHWNMHERELNFRERGGFKADDDPVTFVHFSGWDWRNPEIPSKYALSEVGRSKEGWVRAGCEYRDLLLAQGIEESSRWPYSFARASDGSLIDLPMRRKYLDALRKKGCLAPEEHILVSPDAWRDDRCGLKKAVLDIFSRVRTLFSSMFGNPSP